MKKLNKVLVILFVVMALLAIFTVKSEATSIENIAFDVNYYLNTYADLKAVFGNDYDGAYNHFMTSGISEGRIASPYVNIRYYLDTYGDLKAIFGNNYRAAFEHYVVSGVNEGRKASQFIDTRYYLDAYGDLKAVFGNNYGAAFEHYVTCGINEGRKASPYVDMRYYLDTYGDLKAVFGNNYGAAYNHYITCGIKEGRKASPFVDTRYYLNTYGDLKAVFGNNYEAAYNHYITCGVNEGRIASTFFDVKYYLNTYKDLKAVFGNDYGRAYNHYITCGIKEGRNPSASINVKHYLNAYGDLKAVFGNNYEVALNHYLTQGIKEGRTINHKYVESTIAATCTTTGKKMYKCSCGEGSEETIPMIGHKTEKVNELKPTCEVAGHTAGVKCVNCNYTTVKELPATGHKFGQDGKCSVCGKEENTEKEHVVSIKIISAPTATYVGNDLSYTNAKITVKYNTGREENVAIVESMVTGYNKNITTKQTVTVTYENVIDTFEITLQSAPVQEDPVTSIKVTKNPNKMSYIHEDTISLDGIEVKSVTKNGKETVITNYSFKSEADKKASTIGKQKIYITALGYDTYFEVDVAKSTVVNKIAMYDDEILGSDKEISGDAMIKIGTTSKELRIELLHTYIDVDGKSAQYLVDTLDSNNSFVIDNTSSCLNMANTLLYDTDGNRLNKVGNTDTIAGDKSIGSLNLELSNTAVIGNTAKITLKVGNVTKEIGLKVVSKINDVEIPDSITIPNDPTQSIVLPIKIKDVYGNYEKLTSSMIAINDSDAHTFGKISLLYPEDIEIAGDIYGVDNINLDITFEPVETNGEVTGLKISLADFGDGTTGDIDMLKQYGIRVEFDSLDATGNYNRTKSFKILKVN